MEENERGGRRECREKWSGRRGSTKTSNKEEGDRVWQGVGKSRAGWDEKCERVMSTMSGLHKSVSVQIKRVVDKPLRWA